MNCLGIITDEVLVEGYVSTDKVALVQVAVCYGVPVMDSELPGKHY